MLEIKEIEEKAIEWKNSPENPNILGLAYINDFKAGYLLCKKEYDEKLHWISPSTKPQLLDENSIFSENVSIRVENGEYEYSGYYNFQTRQWLIYPNEEPFEFQLIAGWRYFL